MSSLAKRPGAKRRRTGCGWPVGNSEERANGLRASSLSVRPMRPTQQSVERRDSEGLEHSLLHIQLDLICGMIKAGGIMVYFIQSACQHGYIKIGYTSGYNPGPSLRARAKRTTIRSTTESRLSRPTAHTDSHRLTLLGVIKSSYQEEQALHRRFSYARERGEWFYPSPELLLYIKTHTTLPVR